MERSASGIGKLRQTNMMEDPVYNSLPIIVVSAKDNEAASQIITEIIDNDVTESYKAKEADVVQDRIWRIVNKYYTADVRLQGSGDNQLPLGHQSVDAHIIYLQEDECTVSACERRVQAGGEVRVVVSAGVAGGAGGAGEAVRAWCARRRYEPVPLAPPPAGEDDCYGVAYVRRTLHAHAWPGLRRLDQRPGVPPAYRPTESSSPASMESECPYEWEEEGEEAFARALRSLPARAAADHAAARDQHDQHEERVARAERLLGEFCRALGLDLDSF